MPSVAERPRQACGKKVRDMKKKPSEMIMTGINALILTALALACLIPVWHVICASVSDPILLNANTSTIFWPLGNITFSGYERVFNTSYIMRGYLNTLIYVSISTVLGVVLNCFAAYGLSRKKLLFKRPISFLITFTMLFSGGIVPTYLIVRNLKMLNTIRAIVLPNCINVFNVMIMRNSFESIPDSLCEAAEIDGAGHFRVLFEIIILVSKSILAVVFLYYLIQQWNSWFHTALYVTKREMYPLQLWLREIVISESSSAIDADTPDANATNLARVLIKYCAIVISILPMIIIYPLIQRYMVNGVMVGAVKG